MPVGDAVVTCLIVLCSAATLQAAIRAYATRGERLSREQRTLARRFAKGELTRAEFDDHVDSLRELRTLSD